jgi:hypothetical protein
MFIIECAVGSKTGLAPGSDSEDHLLIRNEEVVACGDNIKNEGDGGGFNSELQIL